MAKILKNDTEGFASLIDLLADRGSNKNNSVICLETTGSYSEKICYYLLAKGYSVWSEAPHKISKTFQKQTKNDKVSACQISEYCYRYFDKFKCFEYHDELVEQIRALLVVREQLIKQSTAFNSILHVFKRKYHQTEAANTILINKIEENKESIKMIDKQIVDIINDSDKYGPTASSLKKIPGIGMLFIANIIVITNGFTKEFNYKKLASYIGICPHEFSSGTSVYRKPKSTGYGPARLRKLLYLASMSVRTHNRNFHNYFERKVAEGKNKHLILNNIANKLLRIVCVIIKNGTDYSDNYMSVHPKFLK